MSLSLRVGGRAFGVEELEVRGQGNSSLQAVSFRVCMRNRRFGEFA